MNIYNFHTIANPSRISIVKYICRVTGSPVLILSSVNTAESECFMFRNMASGHYYVRAVAKGSTGNPKWMDIDVP